MKIKNRMYFLYTRETDATQGSAPLPYGGIIHFRFQGTGPGLIPEIHLSLSAPPAVAAIIVCFFSGVVKMKF